MAHQVLGGHSPRRTITNNVQGSRVVQGQSTPTQLRSGQPNVTFGGNRYSSSAPIRQQVPISRDLEQLLFRQIQLILFKVGLVIPSNN